MSVYKIENKSKNLIICFGGRGKRIGGKLPFEFLNYLSNVYKNELNLYFFIDKRVCWYHKGIKDITTNIDETVIYLNNIIKSGNYKKIIFMGVSAGGYAAILFGSLCNITHVISFIPRTLYIDEMTDKKYTDLKTVINTKTNYLLYGDVNITDKNSHHHMSQCQNLESFKNVKIIGLKGVDMQKLRDNGFIKLTIDSILKKSIK